MATMDMPQTADLNSTILTRFRNRRIAAFAVPGLILAYLAYAVFSFDLAGLAQRARLDNAAILLADFWSYKVHVTRDNRNGGLTVAVEGENKGAYPEGMLPDWVTSDGTTTVVDLGEGHIVTYDAAGARYDVPGYGLIDIKPEGNSLKLTAPQPLPDWINASDSAYPSRRRPGALPTPAPRWIPSVTSLAGSCSSLPSTAPSTVRARWS
ncbi:hypothetical protein V6L77_13910 [Pannonibacter sp. Pt2-lr]